MTISQPVRAVVFDLDGLLIDTESLSREGWKWALAEFGHTLTDADYEPCIGRTAIDTCAMWRSRFGDDLPAESANQMRREYMDERLEEVALMPGVEDILDKLDILGLPRAVATSSKAANAERKLWVTGLAARIPIVVSSDLVAQGKPAPDIYLEAARRLGVEPANCLVFEDADGGVEAAHAAGMSVVMVPDLKPPSEASRARAIILNSLEDIADFAIFGK
jgi:HAD superfamily hydrolase (TIGR01509 family)